MGADSLFDRSKALDNEPVFRNANLQPGKTAFHDLLDPDEDDQESASIALQEANRIRSAECLSVVDTTSLYNVAILNLFRRRTNFPTRYGDGSYPVWYGSILPETTIWETAYHMIREEMGRKGHQKSIIRHRVIYEASCTAILVDLAGSAAHTVQLTDPNHWDFTQQIGKRIRNEGHPGLIAPSARHQGGANVVLFKPDVLADPKVLRQLHYQLTPDTMMVDVRDADSRQAVLSIEGAKWVV